MPISKNLEYEKTAFLSKSNSSFIEEMYIKFVNNDPALPDSWKKYFHWKTLLSLKSQAASKKWAKLHQTLKHTSTLRIRWGTSSPPPPRAHVYI